MLGRYDRAMRARQPVGGQTLLARAIAAIRRNNGALFYVPSNFAGAWTDSAGTDPVNEIAVVIGLMTDRSYGMNNLGPNVFTDAGVSFFGGSSRVSAGVYRLLSSDGNYSSISTSTGQTIGKWYRLTFNVDSITSGTLSIDNGAGPAVVGISGTGQKQFLLPVTTSLGIAIKRTTGVTDIQISGVSVQEVFGAVATQATTANKPTVQTNAQGRYVMRFDGSNDSLTTNITTGNEGWVCAGVTFGAADGADETVFSSGASTLAAKGIWMLRAGATETNTWSVVIGNGIFGRDVSSIASVPLKAGPVVVEGGWTTGSITSVVNGINGVPSSRGGGDATPPPHNGFIGAGTGPAAFLNSNMTAFVHCPVLPSAADRAIIRKWIASLQGQSL